MNDKVLDREQDYECLKRRMQSMLHAMKIFRMRYNINYAMYGIHKDTNLDMQIRALEVVLSEDFVVTDFQFHSPQYGTGGSLDIDIKFRKVSKEPLDPNFLRSY